MSLITNRKRPRGFSGSFNGNLIDLEPDSIKSYYQTVFEEGNDNINEDEELDQALDVDEDINNDEDDDDLIILEERNLNDYKIKPKARRNNSDSILLFDQDSFQAFNLFKITPDDSNSLYGKKRRTSSLPQLPQVKCDYYKIPENYILSQHKIGNIKTDVVPYFPDGTNCDDNKGHYIIELESSFANRYIIKGLLGQGTFGKVVECYDTVNGESVAIKIIRNIPKYRDAAKIELRILWTLKKFDDQNLNHCIHLRECFEYRGHICIVTDLLKKSLYDFLENNKFIPFPGSQIQAISKQLIRSTRFLHDLNLIHTDLKPENILLYDDSFVKKTLLSKTLISCCSTKIADQKGILIKSKVLCNPLIQIIDFGSAIFNDEFHSSVVCTRHYRAPEIILGTGWSFPCDMWSIGCILVELTIGEPLFKTHDNIEHLAMIQKLVGKKFDESLVRTLKSKLGFKFFDSNNELLFPTASTPPAFLENVEKLDRLDYFILSKLGLLIDYTYSLNYNYNLNKQVISLGNFTFWWFLIDLLKNLFVIDPEERLTAQEAMNHPWFDLGIEDEGTI